MYSGQSNTIPIDDWVNADVCLDPEGESLPIDYLCESCAMQLCPCRTNGNILKEHSELCIIESQMLQEATVLPPGIPEAPTQEWPTREWARNKIAENAHLPPLEHTEQIEWISCEEDMAWSSGLPPDPLDVHLKGDDFLSVFHGSYTKDTLFKKVLSHLEQPPTTP
jgi:hypothetical protein